MKWLIILLVFGLTSCARPSLESITLLTLNGDEVDLIFYKSNHASIFYFLSPECPLCQNYALNIKQIKETFENDTTKFFGVFPGEYYSLSQIKSYLIKYELDIKILLDPNYELTHALSATVTPEAILVNKNGNVKYQGAIDNWAISLGKKRTVVTEHYLMDALRAIENGTEIPTTKSTPVGCFIE